MSSETNRVAHAIVRKLIARGLTVASAESCTGGGIMAALTSVSGSSACVRGGVVSYATEIKQSVLGVSPKTVTSCGVVSEQTVIEMARGALRVMEADVAVSTSGVSGPSGGTLETPVGTVWMAVAAADGRVTTFKLSGVDLGRWRNTRRAVLVALKQLEAFIG